MMTLILANMLVATALVLAYTFETVTECFL